MIPDDVRDRVRKALQTGTHPEAREQALAELAGLAPEELRRVVDGDTAEAIVGTLASPKRSEQRRASDAIANMVTTSPAVRAALDRALLAADPRLRWGAAYTLARAGVLTPELWPPLRDTLGLEDGDQRWAAAELVCRLIGTHGEMLTELETALGSDNPVLRKMSVYCLRDLGVRDLARIARQRLSDADPGVRLAALSALSRVDPDAAEASMCADVAARLVLDDPEAGVRRAAAATLGALGIATPIVTTALSRAASTDDASLARAAVAALARLETRR